MRLRLTLAILAASGALATSLAAAAPERWLTLDDRAPDHAALALDLNSVQPGAQKGVVNAQVIAVDDTGAWQISYEADCRKEKLHMSERSVIDRKLGVVRGAAVLDAAWAKPTQPTFTRLYEILCRQTQAGGTVISTRRSLMWTLTR